MPQNNKDPKGTTASGLRNTDEGENAFWVLNYAFANELL